MDTLGPDAGRTLLAWYDRHKRRLPWRVEKGAPDAYRVWLSEVMLQQTTVAAVIPYYERFLERWPAVDALAAADDGEVMAAWAGLGYYARARNLLACARTVARDGAFPRTREGLRALPGVGAYTAAAVAAIAFGEAVPVVDGNVERVTARLVRLSRPPKAVPREVEARVAAMLPAERPGDFAQAMMDLGATICTPRGPACALCPLRPACAAAATGDPLDFPKKAARRPRAAWRGAAFVPVRPDGAILVRRRPSAGLLGGMNEPFGTPWAEGEPSLTAPFVAEWRGAGAIDHGFTHATLTLEVYVATVDADAPTPEGGTWLTPQAAGLPTLMRKVVTRALAVAQG
ncbi:A/G-specific adenine glycosylase [Acuticoccus sp.]|uniref:A/G-specific adenine glycosylase n=1 Tax=Acuticoccus sp. TaxID=1904378 RepID=UPI003B52CF9A